jgi:hypothetical protein
LRQIATSPGVARRSAAADRTATAVARYERQSAGVGGIRAPGGIDRTRRIGDASVARILRTSIRTNIRTNIRTAVRTGLPTGLGRSGLGHRVCGSDHIGRGGIARSILRSRMICDGGIAAARIGHEGRVVRSSGVGATDQNVVAPASGSRRGGTRDRDDDGQSCLPPHDPPLID